MDSERARNTRLTQAAARVATVTASLVASAIVACVGSVGCGGSQKEGLRFPLRPPMVEDPDLRDVTVACKPDPKKPTETQCIPDGYESSLFWDGADHSLFRPMSQFFAVDPGSEAIDVNSFDEVPNSSWFENRIGVRPMTDAEVRAGYCEETKPLSTEMPDGSWVVDQGKGDGATPGFRIDVRGVGKFVLKSDKVDIPLRASAAEAVVSRLYWAAGYSTPCNFVVYFRRSLLSLKPNLTFVTAVGRPLPFDQKRSTRFWRKSR